MSRALPALLVPVLASCAASHTEATKATRVAADPAPLTYPAAHRDETPDVYFGEAVADPYRWLEATDAPDTQAWLAAERALTADVLARLPGRDAYARRLETLWTFPRWSTPEVRGGRVFTTYNDGTSDQPVLQVSDGVDGTPRVLLDPATWSDDGTVALASWAPNDDGTKVAYAVAEAGSDWRTWHVVDVASGTVQADTIAWSKFGFARWLPDGSGFFYNRFPAPTEHAEARLTQPSLYFHRLDTPQSDDVLVLRIDDHPDWFAWYDVSDDGRWLFAHVHPPGTRENAIWALDLASADLHAAGGTAGGTWHRTIDGFDGENQVIASRDDQIWVLTTRDAPRRRVVRLPIASTNAPFTDVVPEGEATLRSVGLYGDHLVVSALKDASSVARIHALDGTPGPPVQLPGLGSIDDWSGRADDATAWFGFVSFTRPSTVYRLDVATGATEVAWAPALPFDPDAYVTTLERARSADGTEVPVFVSTRRDLPGDVPQPTLLYGYGGFDIAITPFFKPGYLAWMEAGGVFASAVLRGGGEYGAAWHEAGTLTHKQHVFDDFIGAAEHLIATGRTTSDQLGIHGRSNGGLLVGATLLQRPELFGAAIPSVGVMDMLKYQTWTIGYAWAADYGTSADSPEMFAALRAYSPVHNTRPGTAYPPTLITTAEHDDRVVPAHSFKFAAALQAAQGGSAPILLRVEGRAGHGAGTPVSMLVAEEADKLAFLGASLGLAPPK